MIGVFDSGIGGFTVLRELLRELPGFGFLYLGDTARTPYGTKSPAVVRRYACEDTQLLIGRGAQLIVVACNTVSANAMHELHVTFPQTRFVEVVTHAVEEAVRVTTQGRIGVIGTRATIHSRIYERTITHHFGFHDRGIRDNVEVISEACPLLVPLVEEGWLDREATRIVVHEYLAPFKKANIDTLILGCTHYPMLEPIIAEEMGEGVTIVNSARATASAVRSVLERDAALAAACRGSLRQFLVTDRTSHAEEIASQWLGMAVHLEGVELVQLTVLP